MSQIAGGMTCTSAGLVIYNQDAGGGNVSCPIKYKSCASGSGKLTCSVKGGYNGPMGPGGWMENRDPIKL